MAAILAVVLALVAAWVWLTPDRTDDATHDTVDEHAGDSPIMTLERAETPAPDMSAQGRARRAVAAMTLEERVGQLVMVPLFAGQDPASLADAVGARHAGSVLLLGNWTSRTSGVRAAVDAVRALSGSGAGLVVAADQEGGLVQHLQGPGFDAMPSGLAQGGMAEGDLRAQAGVWGSQLKAAGVDVDLAPVSDTVRVARASNAPIGALGRDFGLDAAGNASHASAFVEGMRDAGVGAAIKHYPSLGAVTGNTDFTAEGILDVTTTLDGEEAGVFHRVIDEAQPSMVMMSLATYQAIDPSAPAAFSPTIISDLRQRRGYQGVVISDSLSAAALGSIPVDQLGVRLVEAGGDLACIGESSYVSPILDGLNARAASDPAFAELVTRSAERVMTLKYQLGLAS